jgi:hypothetical protein
MYSTLAIEHLLLRLRPIRRALRVAAQRQTELAGRLLRPGVSALCVTPDQVESLLDDLDGPSCGRGEAAALTPDETAQEERLRERALGEGGELPLDALVTRLALTPFEQDCILLCAAPEVDRAYERVIAYVLDDLNRRQPCIELLASLTTASLQMRLERRQLLGPYGRLRRCGVLESGAPAITEARQELRLTPSACAFLLGASSELANAFRDPGEVSWLAQSGAPPWSSGETLVRLGQGLGDGTIDAVGIWGPRHSGRDEAVHAIAAGAARPLRCIALGSSGSAASELAATVHAAALAAAALQSLLWVQLVPSDDEARAEREDAVGRALAASPAPLVLTGVHPWRPATLLETRSYAEIELSPTGASSRRRLWSAAFPELDVTQTGELASRFRLSGPEIHAVERIARTRARLAGNGRHAPVAEQVDAACRTVTQRRSAQFATLVQPRRGQDDLVLPADLHRQVLDVAAFVRVWSQVEEGWGFGYDTGGVKALFTGDPGTGKTLAAEVIACLLGLPLLKVDLAQVVSKWIGETEKNLESVFSEAEESHSVLFFDEADALFGKRGEVQHGTDRYANLEVSYLLQRLDGYGGRGYHGLIILASNLRDQIDPAFARRFHVTVHFPRPGLAERRRIWEIAFPTAAPLDPTVDLDVLSRLELTGAGITGVAHTAALLAADAGAPLIGIAQIVQAAVRQYRREARILTPSELGPYAPLLKGSA